MSAFFSQVQLTLRWAIRDRLFYAVLGVALVMLLLVPVFSSFSMRQVQELSITLSLSVINLILIVVAVLLGTSTIWREIEKKYTASVLTLPLSRSSYLLGKFVGVSLFLLLTLLVLGTVSLIIISISAAGYPSEIPIPWFNLFSAYFFILLKSILIASFAIFFSTVGTSFFLPFFSTFAIYLAGSGSQEVFEYITGKYGETISPLTVEAARIVYYVLPNLASFDLQVYAIYGLELPVAHIGMVVVYFIVYTSIMLFLALWTYNRRQLS